MFSESILDLVAPMCRCVKSVGCIVFLPPAVKAMKLT